ncbi:hypothetical protein JZ751_027963 [Albula glossodonta]|uniref:Uncharacterized protein n=1 Tax=Albula glossodonta TaxID=121402 RepID=A0A8T2PJ48_9TELE|nr:hypothetical protein JZ751_027963 [Albula glossodonta]
MHAELHFLDLSFQQTEYLLLTPPTHHAGPHILVPPFLHAESLLRLHLPISLFLSRHLSLFLCKPFLRLLRKVLTETPHLIHWVKRFAALYTLCPCLDSSLCYDSASPCYNPAFPCCDSSSLCYDSASLSARCDSASPWYDSSSPCCDSSCLCYDFSSPCCDSASPCCDSASPCCDSACPCFGPLRTVLMVPVGPVSTFRIRASDSSTTVRR